MDDTKNSMISLPARIEIPSNASRPHLFKVLRFAALSTAIAISILAAIRLVTKRPLSALVTGQVLSVEPSIAHARARTDEVVFGRYTIRNVSGSALTVLGVATDCGCTTATQSFPIHLSPQEATELELRVTVGRPNANGEFVRNAMVLVNREGVVPPLLFDAQVVGPPSPQ